MAREVTAKMNLFSMLNKRAEDGEPIRIGMIGAGKFGTMFLSQVRRLAGIHLIGVADLSPANARSNMEFVGWESERFAATSLDQAAKEGGTHVGDDWQALVAHPAIDIVIECTGAPVAADGVRWRHQSASALAMASGLSSCT